MNQPGISPWAEGRTRRRRRARYPSGMSSPGAELLAGSIGNTRSRVGVLHDQELDHAAAASNGDLNALAAAILEAPVSNPGAPLVIASVNTPVAEPLIQLLEPKITARGGDIYRF